MRKSFKQLNYKIGQVPGHLQFVGEQKQTKTQASLMAYDAASASYAKEMGLSDLIENAGNTSLYHWVNIEGLHDLAFLEGVGQRFQIEPLVLEDILNTFHLPKLEDGDTYIFSTLKMLYIDKKTKRIDQEQISFLLHEKVLISFQEKEGDIFDSIRMRILDGKGKVRKKKVDYLYYLLLDSVVDNYYLVLEHLQDQTDSLESQLLRGDTPELEEVLQLKKQLVELRKSIFPLTDMFGKILKIENTLIEESTLKYFRDVKDHVFHVTEALKDLREMMNSMIDLYMMNSSNQLNHVMKTLTIVATVFIPLTFIAGIYGMNFEYMPELQWRYGYFFAWGLMIVIAIIMYLFMKKRKWI